MKIHQKVIALLLCILMVVGMLPMTALAASDDVYSITAPHVVKLSATKAKSGETVKVTADKNIDKVTATTASGKDVAVTKTAGGFTFTMPAEDVTMKTYYTKTAIADLQNERQKGNPFIPLYDYNPDTEPHVFEDPDNPGKYRLYFYTSHDMDKNHYCSNNHVLYSCPVDDPFNWTYHGVIVGPNETLHSDILYAPDCGCVNDPTSPTGKYYYYFPCNQAGGRNTMVLGSTRPDGPFEVLNWADDSHNRTLGNIMTFDPSIFVDDDGKIYGYWGGYNSTCHGAQLNPEKVWEPISGTQKDDMLGDGLEGSTFGFYEASSMRKVGDTYVFVYSSHSNSGAGLSRNYATLAYAYSTVSPLGPWTYGGIIVDATGESGGTFNGGNTHGSLVKLGDQWYISYHRNLSTYARQSMIDPVEITIDESGAVKITKAEVSSQGFYINGLNPYAKVSLGTACYKLNANVTALYDEGVNSLPVTGLGNNSVIGLKYFDFNTKAPEGSGIVLNMDLIPHGVNATINVWLRPTTDVDVRIGSANSKAVKVGEYKLTSDMPREMTTITIDTPDVSKFDGKWGVFFTFSDASGSDIADLYDMQFEFSDHEHKYKDVVTEPTCTEGGYTAGVCSVCQKSSKRDFTNPLGHAWDEGTVTVKPTTTSKGLMTYKCTRKGCDATKTKTLPREGITVPEDIDFTDPACADMFEIVNQDVSSIREGEGLYMITTKDGFEPAGNQLEGSAATTPKDAVVYAVEGDWEATLKFDFNTNGASNGYYQFFGFYAAAANDDGSVDYNNMAGIRGGDNHMQDFLRVDGNISTDTDGIRSAPGLDTNTTYWYRIAKTGDTYVCYRSADGEEFTEMFKYEDSGIDADKIVIDAYTGMTTGYVCMLKSLTFEDSGVVVCKHENKETKNAKEATCGAAGYTGDVVCKDCGKVLEKGKSIPATGEHTWGDWTVTKPATTEEEGEKTHTCTVCGAKETEKIEKVPAKEFEDVKNKDAFYYESVYWAVGKGITAGTDATHFSPDANCTRGQAVTFLWRAAGSPEVEGVENPFEDIKESDFYYKAVLWAVKTGVTTGLDKTHFGPANKLTRGQFVTFLWRAKGGEEVTSDKEFTDVPASKYCAKAVAWAVESDITAGTDATHFSPDAKCTRGQVVTFLARAYK